MVLHNMMKYLKNRFDNTFKGRSFIEGIKLLNKPAVTPTIMDDDKITKKEKDPKEENANSSNQNYPMRKNI